MSKRKTTEEFVSEAILKFPQFDYSKVEYVNNSTKVIIICPIHGEFLISPHNLLKSNIGCPECVKQYKRNKFNDSIEQFIQKAKQVHGDKYDYSKFNYVNAHIKGTIICPEHGEFEQNANNHLNGKGCPYCYQETKILTTEEFIEKAHKVHGNLYNYSKVNYKGTHIPVTIICPKHGEFEQTPNSHLRGRGCPKCNNSKGELIVKEILEELNIQFQEQYKIKLPNKTLIVDFIIRNNDILYIIEYNGMQHYIPVEHFGGEIRFQEQQNRDELLRNYCKENNIRLLEISYKENENNIKNLLIDFLDF